MTISRSTLQHVVRVASVYCLAFLEGAGLAWPAPATELLSRPDSPVRISDADVTWMGAIAQIGKMVLPIVFGIFVDEMSRKKLFLASALVQGVSWLLLTMTASVPLILLSQFLYGVGSAFYDIIAFVYLAEVVSPHRRATVATIVLLLEATGQEMQFALEGFDDYRLLSMIPLAVTAIALLMTNYIVESPYHLFMVNKQQEALENLSILQSGHSDDESAACIRDFLKYTEDEKPDGVSFFEFVNRAGNLKVCLFLFLTSSIVQASGQFPFLTYGPVIMKPYTNELNISFVMNILGLLGLLGSGISLLVIDWVGRRTLLLFGFGTLSTLQFILTAIFYVEDYSDQAVPILPRVMVLLIMIIYVVSLLTVYSVMHVVASEMFPHALKIRGNCALIVCVTMTAFFTRLLFFLIADRFGIGFNFLLYSVLAWLAMMYVRSYYVDTTGMTLTQIRYLYS